MFRVSLRHLGPCPNQPYRLIGGLHRVRNCDTDGGMDLKTKIGAVPAMTKTVAFIGTEGGVSFSGLGFETALQKIGQNTGNALFQSAMWRLIRNPKMAIGIGTSVELVREVADMLVIPAANQVNPAWDLSAWATFVEAIDLPIVCIGLGAQAHVGAGTQLNLQPGTERYLRVVAERTTTIGVRGKYTQDVLAAIGIENTEVTGCPSQTINNRVRGRTIQEQMDGFAGIENPKLGYVLGTLEEKARDTDRYLAGLVREVDHQLILQTDPRLMSLIHQRDKTIVDMDYLSWIAQILRPDLDGPQFADYLLRHGIFYSDARTWIDAMRRTDLVLGLRIHGAVAAIQAEKLGICVAFDSRTLELAHTMGYPYVRANDIRQGMNLADIVAAAEFSSDRFDHLRVKKRELIRSILLDAGCLISD